MVLVFAFAFSSLEKKDHNIYKRFMIHTFTVNKYTCKILVLLFYANNGFSLTFWRSSRRRLCVVLPLIYTR